MYSYVKFARAWIARYIMRTGLVHIRNYVVILNLTDLERDKIKVHSFMKHSTIISFLFSESLQD